MSLKMMVLGTFVLLSLTGSVLGGILVVNSISEVDKNYLGSATEAPGSTFVPALAPTGSPPAVVNPTVSDPIVECGPSRNGTKIKMNSSECKKMIDCQLYGDVWVFSTKEKCNLAQAEITKAAAEYINIERSEYLQPLVDSYARSLGTTNQEIVGFNAYGESSNEIDVYGSADSYTRYGNTIYGSDGSSYTQYGNTVYGNDGSSYTKYGNTIYDNGGSTWTRYGNTTYGNDGTSYTQYGNTIYGSDGSSATQYGNTLYTNP